MKRTKQEQQALLDAIAESKAFLAKGQGEADLSAKTDSIDFAIKQERLKDLRQPTSSINENYRLARTNEINAKLAETETIGDSFIPPKDANERLFGKVYKTPDQFGNLPPEATAGDSSLAFRKTGEPSIEPKDQQNQRLSLAADAKLEEELKTQALAESAIAQKFEKISKSLKAKFGNPNNTEEEDDAILAQLSSVNTQLQNELATQITRLRKNLSKKPKVTVKFNPADINKSISGKNISIGGAKINTVAEILKFTKDNKIDPERVIEMMINEGVDEVELRKAFGI